MSINLSTIAQNAAGNAIVELIDDGTDLPSGYVEIWAGDKPATPQATATGTLLASCQFSNPAFASFNNGKSISNPISQDTAIANSGTARWFRVYNRDSKVVFDGDIGVTGSGKEIEFDTINFVKGGTITIASIVTSMQ